MIASRRTPDGWSRRQLGRLRGPGENNIDLIMRLTKACSQPVLVTVLRLLGELRDHAEAIPNLKAIERLAL